MQLRNTDRASRSSGRRNNVVSWISEVKDTSNVAVRKKRGRRAPPSAKRLRDKRVNKAIESDGAVDSDSDDTDGQVGKSQPSAHIEEQEGPSSASEEQDHSTNSKDMLQKASSQNTKKVSRSSTSSKQGASHLEQEGANEDGSHVQVAAVYKDIDNERSSQEIRDDVSNAQVDTTSSNDKSSEEVEDVKVCDICGDVGEEEKLAVCSRCNDGAEHTYCMRVMTAEVPDSEWLCEDCQTAVESEKENRLEKSQVKVGTSKELSFEGEINKPPIAAKSRNSSDCKLKVENVENKESDTTNEGNDTVETRTEEDAAMTSSIRDTIPETGGLYTGADSRKRMQPSHEIFMFDADKGKQPSHQVATSLAFNALKNQAPQPRGQLSKSTSFNNSKVPKVKQLLNEVPQKPKFLKESWSSIVKKEGPISMTTKSATFKKPKPCEPANKAKSSVLPSAEEPRVTNQLVSYNVTNGNSELKKPPLAKVPGSTMLSNAERSSCGILGSGAHRKVIQNSDSSHQETKIKDPTGFRQGASSSNRNVNKPSLSTQANEQDMRYILSIPGSGVDYSKLKLKDNHPSLSATPGISSDNGCIMPNDHRDEPAQGVSAGDEPLFSTVPELDWIWQGGFELQRTGRSPELCDGFQAHLSCSAAQLVLDVVKKFPSKVQLEEVPRQNSWLTQFQENDPTYDNIGLFFFARDVQSKLVENMLKNDLVLRGSVGTVELLILPSNILSKNFQRWNMFYFLWGLFRVGKKDSSNLPSYVSTSRLERNFNDDPWAMDWSTTALSSTHSFSQNRSGFGEILVKSTNFAPSLEASHEVCLNGENFLNQPVCGRGLDDHLDSDTETSSTISNGGMGPSSMSMQRKHQKLDYPEHKDKMRDTFGDNVSERDFDVNAVPVTCSVSLTHIQEEPGMVSTTINLNDADNLMDIDHNDADNLMDIDHVNTCEVSAGALDCSHASGGADKRSFRMANAADEVPEHKKIKLDMSMNSGLYENAYNGRLSSKVHSLSASFVNDGTSNKPMAGSSSSGGKCVFPFDLNAEDDAVSENIVNHY
ncbi:ASI1-immunoprecipitated protein 2-like isoform X2 [Miscanthus floridulus]|uniref:ASI1-immunoprecipitated protein 2-like isoform X2 n=1 Tax=Miscanthus floridulus TaxID=154761 RepID=UPI003459091F